MDGKAEPAPPLLPHLLEWVEEWKGSPKPEDLPGTGVVAVLAKSGAGTSARAFTAAPSSGQTPREHPSVPGTVPRESGRTRSLVQWSRCFMLAGGRGAGWRWGF